MKYIITLSIILICIDAAGATIGTFAGKKTGLAPSETYKLGYASEKPSKIEIQIPDKKGINITYPKTVNFNPSSADTTIQREGENLPAKRIEIQVRSTDPVKRVYNIPVTLRAFDKNSGDSGSGASIIQERQYNYKFKTKYVDKFKGELINSDEESKEASNDSDSKRAEIINQDEGPNKSKKPSRSEEINLPLLLGVVAVFGYIIYEVIS